MSNSALDEWALVNVKANCTRKSMIETAINGGNSLDKIYKALGKAYIALQKNPWPNPGSVKLTFSIDEPNVIAFDNLLSAGECQHFINIADTKFQRSTVLKGDSSVVHNARTSSGCWLYNVDSPVIAAVNSRIAEKFNWPEASSEELQVLRYDVGEQYLPHNDYFSAQSNAKQRSATMLIYLQEPEEGGSTYFPESSMHFYPKLGSAILFTYSGNPLVSKTLHGGSPVLRGTKYVATKWFKVIN